MVLSMLHSVLFLPMLTLLWQQTFCFLPCRWPLSLCRGMIDVKGKPKFFHKQSIYYYYFSFQNYSSLWGGVERCFLIPISCVNDSTQVLSQSSVITSPVMKSFKRYVILSNPQNKLILDSQMLQNYAVQHNSHWPHGAIEHIKYDQSKLRCVISVKYIPCFENQFRKNVNYAINTFFITC